MDKDYPVMVKAETKKHLSEFKRTHEAEILKDMKKPRRYVSWDDVISFVLKKLNRNKIKSKPSQYHKTNKTNDDCVAAKIGNAIIHFNEKKKLKKVK